MPTKKQMLAVIYSPSQYKAKKPYFDMLCKHTVKKAYEICIYNSRSQARRYLNGVIANHMAEKGVIRD